MKILRKSATSYKIVILFTILFLKTAKVYVRCDRHVSYTRAKQEVNDCVGRFQFFCIFRGSLTLSGYKNS